MIDLGSPPFLNRNRPQTFKKNKHVNASWLQFLSILVDLGSQEGNQGAPTNHFFFEKYGPGSPRGARPAPEPRKQPLRTPSGHPKSNRRTPPYESIKSPKIVPELTRKSFQNHSRINHKLALRFVFRPDLGLDLRLDLNLHLRFDSRPDPGLELRLDLWSDLRLGLNHDLKLFLRLDLRIYLRLDLRFDLRLDLNHDLRLGLPKWVPQSTILKPWIDPGRVWGPKPAPRCLQTPTTPPKLPQNQPNMTLPWPPHDHNEPRWLPKSFLWDHVSILGGSWGWLRENKWPDYHTRIIPESTSDLPCDLFSDLIWALTWSFTWNLT